MLKNITNFINNSNPSKNPTHFNTITIFIRNFIFQANFFRHFTCFFN